MSSRVERITYRKRETVAVILEADNASIRTTPDGGAVLELFRYSDQGKPVESFQFHLAPDDRKRLRGVLNSTARGD